MSKKQVSRRDFLRRSAVAAAGAGAAISGISDGWAQEKANIPKRVLGRTKLNVTEVSFGGTRLYDRAVLEYGIDRGINFVHTCAGYTKGAAIKACGALMKTRRDEVVLGLKEYPREDRVDDALEQLNTSYVDMLVPGIHSVESIASADLKEGLLAMKNKGKTKWVGFAVHKEEPAVLAKAVELGYFDVVLLCYNPGNRAQLDPIVEKMDKIGMGFVVMKGLKGVPSGEHETAVKSILNNPKVDSLVRGFTTKEQVDDYIKWSLTRTAATPADERRVAAKMAGVACTMCGNCSICPRNVAVTDIFRFEYYAQDGQPDVARDEYAALDPSERVTNCDDCGLCEEVCSNNLPIRRRLKEVHALLA